MTASPHQLKNGSRIRISYSCYDEENHLLETTGNDAPAVTLGNEELLPALEKQLKKMQPGETVTLTLKPKDAFGPVYEDLFYNVTPEQLELDIEELEVGDTLELAEEGEEPRPATIVEINDNSLLVDCNHPMAGKTLTFILTLISIL